MFKNIFLLKINILLSFFLLVTSCKQIKVEEPSDSLSVAASQGTHAYGITKATYRCWGTLNDRSCMVQTRDPVACGYGTGNVWINADPGDLPTSNALNRINAGISDDFFIVNGTSECGQCLYIVGQKGSAFVMVTDKGHPSGSGRVESDTMDIDNVTYMSISGEGYDLSKKNQGRNEMTTKFTRNDLNWKHPLKSVTKVSCDKLFNDRRVMYVPLDVSPGTTDFNIRRGKTAIAKVEMQPFNTSQFISLSFQWGSTYRLSRGYANGFPKNTKVKVRITWKDGSKFEDEFIYDVEKNGVAFGSRVW